MKSTTQFVRVFLLLLLGSLGCVDGSVDKPKPPSVDIEQQRIGNPEGTVNQQNVGEVAGAAQDTLEELAPICGWDVLPMFDCETEACAVTKCDYVELIKGLIVIAAIFTGSDNVAPDPSDPNAPPKNVPASDNYINSAEGFGVVRRICAGYGSGDRTNPDNGHLELNIGFTDQGLDAVLWGVFKACRYTTESLGDVSIDGNVVIRTERSEGKANSKRIFIVSDLIIRGFGKEKRVFSLYQLDEETQTTRLYLPVHGGIVFFKSPEGAGFQDQVGVVTCDFDGKSCTRADAEVLTW